MAGPGEVRPVKDVRRVGVSVLPGHVTSALCPSPDTSVSRPPQRMGEQKSQVHLVNYVPYLIAGSDSQAVITLIGLIS